MNVFHLFLNNLTMMIYRLALAKLIYDIVQALLPNFILDHRDEINQRAQSCQQNSSFSFFEKNTR